MRIDVLTLFPEMFDSPMSHSILRRAQESGLIEIVLSNIRDFATDAYSKVDDKPYGGGPGMVMKCQPVFDCYEHIAAQDERPGRVLMMSPQGRRFDQQFAQELSQEKRLVFLAGRYEGFDERIRLGLGAEQVSIGDYVLTGGELPAMVMIDSVARLISGVLGDDDSSKDESFSEGLLEYPQYTRPDEYREMRVPEILLSGDHAKIAQWRKKQSIERTRKWRPDLLENLENKTKEIK